MSSTDESGLSAQVGALNISVNDLRRTTEVGLTEVKGELKLLNEKVGYLNRDQEELKTRVKTNESRITAIEADYVTRRSVYTMLTLMAIILSAIIAVIGIFRF